ncbi:MAG: hypothetical protein EOO72_00740 [Myxococcaceae bacterium]|nr:MAG: hypothetical protein EOO72_00740 [Myxococcaceae bacterium]
MGTGINVGVNSAGFLTIASESGAREVTALGVPTSRVVQVSTMLTGPLTPGNSGRDLAVLRIYPPVVAQAFARKPSFQTLPDGMRVASSNVYVLSPDAMSISDVVRVRGGQFLGTGDRYVPLAQKGGAAPAAGSPAALDAADGALVQASSEMAAQTAQQVEASEPNALAASDAQADSASLEGATVQTTALRTSSPTGRQGFVTAYTKARKKVFVVGGTDLRSGQVLGDIWMFRTNVWQQVRTPLVVGRPLAATYSFRDDRLWIVDEILVGRTLRARVIAINPETGVHQILGTWPRAGTFDEVWLTLDLDGSLLLTSSSATDNRHVVTHIALPTSGAQVDSQVARTGVLAFAPVVDPTGYAFAISPGSKQMPPLTRYTTLGGTPATWASVGGTL